MANTGDFYTVQLKAPHLDWGEIRYTDTRTPIPGEGYIPIPANDASRLRLLNSNGTGGRDVFGENLFYCHSADGHFQGTLRAQGNQDQTTYAKQFSADGNLRAIGRWYANIGAVPGDIIRVSWTSPTDILIEKL